MGIFQAAFKARFELKPFDIFFSLIWNLYLKLCTKKFQFKNVQMPLVLTNQNTEGPTIRLKNKIDIWANAKKIKSKDYSY